MSRSTPKISGPGQAMPEKKIYRMHVHQKQSRHASRADASRRNRRAIRAGASRRNRRVIRADASRRSRRAIRADVSRRSRRAIRARAAYPARWVRRVREESRAYRAVPGSEGSQGPRGLQGRRVRRASQGRRAREENRAHGDPRGRPAIRKTVYLQRFWSGRQECLEAEASLLRLTYRISQEISLLVVSALCGLVQAIMRSIIICLLGEKTRFHKAYADSE